MPQHSTLEEVFHDRPQPIPAYQEGYSGPHPERENTYVPAQQEGYSSVPAQKVLMPDGQHRSTFSIGGRLALALISLGMTFAMCLMVVMTTSSMRTSFFALVFAGTAVLINLIFNRGH